MMYERNPAQASFYHSQRWVRVRGAYLDARHHVCERCGRPATVVHHKRYITPANVHDPSVTLNPDNLEALCVDCHAREHHGSSAVAPGLAFDSNGELRRI